MLVKFRKLLNLPANNLLGFHFITFLANVANCEYVSVLHASRMSYINKTLNKSLIIVENYGI